MASIKQRADGVWRARYRDEAGREHAKHFTLKRDAQRWLDEVAAAVVTGQYVDPKAGRVTWDEWNTRWMERQSWAVGTHEAATVAVQSVPWRDSHIAGIKSSHVQAWVAGESKRGLAASTIKTRLNYIQMSFRAAVADKVIVSNPALGVKAPRGRRAEAAMRILTPDEVLAALDAADDFRSFVEVCVFAGLRLGEAAGLQLRDVNFLGRSITVARQVQGATNKAARIVPPKYMSQNEPSMSQNEPSSFPTNSSPRSQRMSNVNRSPIMTSSSSSRRSVDCGTATTRRRSGAGSGR